MSMRATNHASNATSTPVQGGELKWADLTETEKSAASLGVNPESWQPISFLNDAHYETLLKTNAIDGDLAKRLEAYKHVSLGGK